MPDKRIRVIDPLGIVALANVLVRYGHQHCPSDSDCSCQHIPVTCSCEHECSCEHIPVCPNKPDQTDILDMLSNPIFREVVKGFDINKMKTIEDFLSIVDEIRTKMDSSELTSRSTDTKKP